jgi:hypothetical protein
MTNRKKVIWEFNKDKMVDDAWISEFETTHLAEEM